MDSPRDIALHFRSIVNLIAVNNPNMEIIKLSTLPCLEELQSYRVLNVGIRDNYMIDLLDK